MGTLTVAWNMKIHRGGPGRTTKLCPGDKGCQYTPKVEMCPWSPGNNSNCNLLLENRKSCLEFWEHTIYSTDFFQSQSCDSWTRYPGEPENFFFLICSTSQQGTEHSIFRIIFRIRFEDITAKIVQITSFIADFFKIQSSDSPMPSHGELEKKSVEPRSRDRAQHIRIRFEVITTMIVKSTTFIADLIKIQSS